MTRKIAVVAAAAVSTTGLVAASLALASAASSTEEGPGDSRTVMSSTDEPPVDMLAALARDLKITTDQARNRLIVERRATEVERLLRAKLGKTFGGGWLDARAGTLVVGITDPVQATLVRSAGAVPRTVARSSTELEALKKELDRRAAAAPRTVPAWYVDTTTNSLVMLTQPGATRQARAFVRASGLDVKAVRFVPSSEQPRALIDVIGGNAYFTGNSRCSVGFAVTGGFVTAGHCGAAGRTTRQPSGTVAGSSFPGNDYAWVRVTEGNTPQPLVNRHPGTVPVAGSTDAPVGSSVCRSGSTTGWHCGVIRQKNATVTYPQGRVTGLTRTDACAEPGDSGGSWISGDQAQGVTSGGSGNCRSGGVTYFQPVNEILTTYRLTLTVTGGGGGEPPTTPSPAPTPTQPTPTAPTQPGGGTSTQERAVLDLTNAERRKKGCAPLALDDSLVTAAGRHATDMVKRSYFSHTNPDGKNPFDRMRAAGFRGRSMGENIAAGYKTPESVMAGWMGSSGHRANILNCNYNKIGVGYDPGSLKGMRGSWVQNFGRS